MNNPSTKDSIKTLVLVHGFMGSALNWGPIVTRLKQDPELEGWKILTPDLLGHGGRRGPKALNYDRLTHAKLCADLKMQLQEHLGSEENFVALGHSFGLRPLLGLSLDAEIAPLMRVLIVEDATPEITQDNFDRLRGILSRVPVPFKSRDEAKSSIEQLFAGDARLAAFLFSNIRPMDIVGSNEKLHTWRFDKKGLLELLQEAFALPLWSEWSKYPQKIHLITGEHSDHVTPERLERALQRRAPKPIQHHQIAQSGHWVHSDQPDTFTECVVKILKDV